MTFFFLIFLSYALLAEAVLIAVILIDMREILDDKRVFNTWYRQVVMKDKHSELKQILAEYREQREGMFVRLSGVPFPVREYAENSYARQVIAFSLGMVKDTLAATRGVERRSAK